MFTAMLFITAKRWKQRKYPSTAGWMNKMCFSRTMAYFLAVKRNETLSSAKIWISFKNMLKEVRKDYILYLHLHKLSTVGKSMETPRKHISYCWGLEVGTGINHKGVLWHSDGVGDILNLVRGEDRPGQLLKMTLKMD